MRWLLAGIAIAFVAIRTAGGVGTDPADDRVRLGLVGTWNCVLKNRPDRFKDVMHIKHVTPADALDHGTLCIKCLNRIRLTYIHRKIISLT